MITFTPTDEQQMLQDAAHRLADNDIRKIAHEADELSETAAGVIKKGWDLGILPGLIPEEFGGYADAQSSVTAILALEELAWGDLGIALNIWAPSVFAMPILISGTDDQKKQLLPLFCNGDRPVLTAGCIEPHPLFDVWKPSTTATKTAKSIALEGEKSYVPLASDAEQIIIYARDSETGKVDGYIIPKEAEGLEICERDMLMGIRPLPTFRIRLSGVKVNSNMMIGGEGGTDYAAIVNRSRVALGALAVGVARASYEYALGYARDRIQFGVPIATKQAVAFRLADMAIETDASRLLVWEAAWKIDQGQDITNDAAVLKHYVAQSSLFVTDSGVQILGGHGYIREHPVERWLRNARGFAAFEGLAAI